MTEPNAQPPDDAHAPSLPITEEDFADLVDSMPAIVGRALGSGQLRLPAGTTLGSLAEDLLSDAILTAYEKASEYDRSRPVVPWILRIAAKKLLSFYRDESRRKTVSIDVIADTGGDYLFALLETSDAEDALQLRMDVERALDTLKNQRPNGTPSSKSAADAAILRRRYIEDASVEDLAEEHGISVDAVYKRLSRARESALPVLQMLGLG